MQAEAREFDSRSRSTAPGSSYRSHGSNGSDVPGQHAAALDPALQPIPLFSIPTQDNDGPIDTAGIIQKLELTNFLCHSSLALEFNPRINYIIGKNGSGKSAIMTAIMVVLGTKAVDTCRGKSLTSFIKHGTRQAKIVIHLANTGRNAYQPERYGESIVLTKVIPYSGSCKTLIAVILDSNNDDENEINKRNQAESSSFPERGIRQVLRPELENIMMGLKITLPNPFALMTQETMKTFLTSNDEAEMYQLLQAGTGIREAILIHQGLKDKMNEMVIERNILSKELKNSNAELEEQLKMKMQLLKVKHVQNAIKELENEMMWATVVGEEAALKVLQNQLQKHLNIKRDRENQLRKHIEQQETIRLKLKNLEGEIQQCKSGMDAKRGERTELKEVFEASGSVVETATRELKLKEQQLQVARADRLVLQQGIDKINKHSMAEEVSRRTKQKQESAKLQQELTNLTATKEGISLDLVRLRDEMKQNKTAVNEKRGEYNDVKTKYNSERSELNQSKKQAGTLPTVYGPRMSELLKAIDKAYEQGQFSAKPIGPIGLHVHVTDPKWELAVESFLRSEFRNFFCNTNEDRVMLEKVCKKVISNYTPVIVSSTFMNKVHDVRKYKTTSRGDLVSFMDVLDVANPDVMNYLIDQKRIESVLLCPTTEKALNLMGNIKSVPHNCSQMITQSGEQVYPQPLFRYYCSEVSTIQYLVKTKEESIAAAEQKLAEDAKRMARLEDELSQLHRATQRIKTEFNKINNLSKNTEDKEMDLKRRIDASHEEEQEVSQDAFSSLQEEIESCEGKIRELENDRKGLLENLKVAKAERSLNESLLEALVPDFRKLKEQIDSLQDRKINLENCLSSKGTKEVYMHKKNEEMGEQEAKLQRDVEVQETAVREAEAIASQSCPRVNTKRSVAVVKKDILEMTTFVDSLSSNLESMDKVLIRITQLQSLQTNLQTAAEKVKIALEELENALKDRKRHYNNKIILIFLQITEMFGLFFYEQPYDGCLVFRHDKREMSIKLHSKENKDCEIKNPSGGERTFTTIAMVLSVWERLRFPFYVLDEFDVFLDVWNRRITADLMTQMARGRKKKQFIFLTPLSFQQAACPHTTIFRLDDPRPGRNADNDTGES